MFYMDQLQMVADDFIERIEEITRDREGVAPDTFLPELLNYSQECITLVSLGESEPVESCSCQSWIFLDVLYFKREYQIQMGTF